MVPPLNFPNPSSGCAARRNETTARGLSCNNEITVEHNQSVTNQIHLNKLLKNRQSSISSKTRPARLERTSDFDLNDLSNGPAEGVIVPVNPIQDGTTKLSLESLPSIKRECWELSRTRTRTISWINLEVGYVNHHSETLAGWMDIKIRVIVKV